ncbi:hypothetical protein C4572_00880 [Candidatus Parcubacteria bacterium]|nr:MAG: hypothetical protein C4572_00880 [Candidatus Parcubacteria bacterium]
MNRLGFMKIFSLIFLGFFPVFNFVSASEIKCSATGYSIFAINGIFVDEDEADDNKTALEKILPPSFNNQPITVDYLHNPSHLAGLGDLVKVVYQKIFEYETVMDYDLVEMIRDASEKVKTQKVLLVAHSQGNFYANSFYGSVAGKEGGVPKESIGVYAVATPAARVAGEGGWLTSDTDKVIAGLMSKFPFKQIMPPNDSIVLKEGDDEMGHNFSLVYLKYSGGKIVSDIQSSLSKLTSSDVQEEEENCIDPPKITLAHKTTGALLGVSDFAGESVVDAAKVVGEKSYQLGSLAVKTTEQVASAIIKAPALILGGGQTDNSAAVAGNPGNSQPEPAENSAGGLESVENSAVLPGRLRPARQPLFAGDSGRGRSAEFSTGEVASRTAEFSAGDSTSELWKTSLTLQVEDNQPGERSFPQPLRSRGSNFSSIAQLQNSLDEMRRQAEALMEAEKGAKNDQAAEAEAATRQASRPTLLFLGPLYPGFGGGAAPSQISLVSESNQQEEEEEEEQEPDSLSAPNLLVPQCDYSLATDGCLLATTTVSFSWQAVSGASHYAVSKNGEYATTTELNFVANIPDFSDYNFSVSASSAAISPASSGTSTQTVSVATIPIAINEIAWMGTTASSYDEWLEIKNNTSHTIDLSQWAIESQDGLPYIALSDAIGPKEYLILERRQDAIIVNQSIITYGTGASQWAMSNSGEELILSHSSTTLDRTPSVAGEWAAGDSATRKTMERVNPKGSGTDPSNWTTWGANIDFIKSGEDTDNNSISGTPGQCNSASFININNGQNIYQDLTLEKDNCYYVSENIQVSATSTLAIESGVQVSLYLNNLVVNGVLDAEGEESNPIVFDSFSENPTTNRIRINNDNGTSTMTNVVISNTGGIRLNNGADLEITNAEFINNNASIELNNNSSAEIENVTFASTTNEAIAAYNGSSVSVASSTISNTINADAIGIYDSNLSMSSTTIDTVLGGDGIGVYDSTVSIASSTISNVLNGDGITAYHSTVSISTSTISDISSEMPARDGISLYDESVATVLDAVIENVSGEGIIVSEDSSISGNAIIEGEEVEF